MNIFLPTAAVIIFLLLIWNLSLGKKIKVKTSELTKALVKLKVGEERIRILLVNLQVGIAIFSPEGILEECNKRFLELGTSPNLSTLGQPLYEESRRNQTLIKPPQQLPLEVIIEHYIHENGERISKDEFPVNIVISSGKPLHGCIIGVKNPETGDVRWTMADLEPEFNLSNQLSRIIVTLVDITEQKIAEKALKETEAEFYRLSVHDPQTALYNRTFFENELERRQKEDGAGTGLIICDIDGLKLVNDTLGNAIGDNYLETTAAILRRCLPEDTLIARIGEDEFSALIKNISIKEIDRIKSEIAGMLKDFNAQERLIPLSITFGSALQASQQTPLRNLLWTAENVMHREKLHKRQSRKSKNVAILSKMLEARDFITEGHGDRMQELSSQLAQAVGMAEDEIKDMCLFAQFHDIGKIGIPDRILFKPGRLTNDEMSEMKRHTEIGFRIAESSPDLKHIADWILKHHEWWNGNGYPFKLRGLEIPIQCRILSIIDTYDAMTSNRPYRKALLKEEALKEILRCKGTQFDPWLVDKFLSLQGLPS